MRKALIALIAGTAIAFAACAENDTDPGTPADPGMETPMDPGADPGAPGDPGADPGTGEESPSP
jgi:hypothetical protein